MKRFPYTGSNEVKRGILPLPLLAEPACAWHCRHMGFLNDLYLSRKPLAGFVVIGLAWSSYFAQMPVIKGALGASDGTYGMVVLVASLGALAAMWLAPLVDRWAGPMALPVGAAAVALGFLWTGVAPGLAGFALAMTVASAGSGVVDVLVNARIAGIEARTGRALMNLNHGLYSFSYAGAALLTGWAREAGWSPLEVFVTLAITIGCLGAIMIGQDPNRTTGHANEGSSAPPAGLVWIVGFVVLAGFLTEAATEGWSALHLERTLGGGAAEGAMGPAILGLTMGFGRLSGHAISRFVSDIWLMGVACGVSAFGVAVAAGAPTLGVAYLGFAVAGLGISVVAPLALGLLGRNVDPAARLAAISRASVLGYGAFFLGPPMMGLVSQGFGLRAAFYVIAVILMVVVVTLVPALARKLRF